MDLDKGFVWSILNAGRAKLSEITLCGFNKELLTGEGRLAFDKACEHLVAYGDLPSPGVIAGKTNIMLEPVTEPPEFFVHELQGRKIFGGLQTAITDVQKVLSGHDPWAALQLLNTRAREIQQQISANSGLVSLPAISREAKDWYDRIKAGEKGILFPWPSMNDALHGMWPEDFILFVARTKTGKTFLAILIAREAWKQGKRVLFVSPEMSKRSLATRFTAIELRLPYKHVRGGSLGVFDEERWEKAIEEFERDERFMTIGGDFNFNVEGLWAYVDSWEPDLVVTDGLTLFRTDNNYEKRNDQAASVYDELKRGAKRFEVPICGTTQFNRSVKNNSNTNLDVGAIAQTDASGWNTDAAFGMGATEEQRAQGFMTISPLAVREAMMDDFEVNWNFDTMDFSELVKITNQPPGSGAPAANPNILGPTPGVGSAGGSNDPNNPNLTLF